MAKVKVKYCIEATATVDWPDDEMDDFTLDNLLLNIDHEESDFNESSIDVVSVKVNNQPYEF